MFKTYHCKEHGEFTVDRTLAEGELKECPECGKEVTRVFKTLNYLDSEGFCGKVYGCP